MASFHNLIKLISATIILASVMSLYACGENTDTGKSSEKEKVQINFDMSDPLQREAAEGNTDALYDLAYKYQDGVGVPKNEAIAVELFRRAAQDGVSSKQ